MDLIFSFAFFLFSNVIVFIMDRKKRLIINSKFYIKVAQTNILKMIRTYLNLEGLIYIRVIIVNPIVDTRGLKIVILST